MPQSVFDIYNEAFSSDELTDLIIRFPELVSTIHMVSAKAIDENRPQLFTATLPFESLDPLAALEFLGERDEFQYYWEHPDENLALSAGKEVVKIRTNQRDRFRIVHKHFEEWQKRTVSFSALTHSLSGLHFLGGFSFQEQPQEHQWRSFGTAGFVVPEWLMIRDGQLTLLTVTLKVTPGDSFEEIREGIRKTIHKVVDGIKSNASQSTHIESNGNGSGGYYHVQIPDDARLIWKETVEQARQKIAFDEFKKIVLAREVNIKLHREPCPTYMLNHLRNEYPTCFTFMVRMNRDAVFLGCTPEKLVSLRSSFILTDGLAGTISRGKTATEDTILERRLLQSDKDLVEHGFVVEAIGERLRDITNNIAFPSQPGIRKYQNVQHLYTPITASLNKNVSPFDLIEKLHPTPAVGGFPREIAVRHIQSLEKIDRGWYAGPVGWINTHGRGEFCVAIRSGLLHQGHARFFAGCGIVASSDPQSEWEETNLKLIPMLSALKHA